MSEAGTGEARWGRFSRLLVVVVTLAFATGIGFLLAVDPYDTGRLTLSSRTGLPAQYPTTANASRARNLAFDAAVFGNSRTQQLNPERLDRLTGRSFVSLAIPGSEPRDQLTVLRWFLHSHGAQARAVVLGLDAPWCAAKPPRLSARFPDWLYDPNPFAYLAGLVRYRSFEAAAARLSYLATGRGGARADGYWDYAPVFAKLGLTDPEASRRRIETTRFGDFANPARDFPALEALRQALRDAPPDTAVVLLRPPVHKMGLPTPGSAGDEAMQDCASRLDRIAAERARTAVIDLLRPNTITESFASFYDYDHYRDPVAVEIERMIAGALGRIGERPGSD